MPPTLTKPASFELVAPLGAGATAKVWRARDALGATVVLKVGHPGSAAALASEAGYAALALSPRLPELVAAGLLALDESRRRAIVGDAGAPFLALRWREGVALGELAASEELARRAAADTGREALLPYLSGPTGIAWVGGDPAVAAKVLDQFAGEHADAFAIKGGLLEGIDLPTADVTRLAKLPPKEQLLAQLAGGIAAPLSGLAGGLSNLIGGLARTLAALQAQKDADAA